MKRLQQHIATLSSALLTIGIALSAIPAQAITQTDSRDALISSLTDYQNTLKSIDTTAPHIEKPSWYYRITFTYSIEKNGSVTSDMSEFANQVESTLNDSRGWSRLNIKFIPVQSGGMFKIILAQASLLPSYSSGCSEDWSCRVGNSVIINNDRWAGASSAWNSSGGSLRDYRHMVINHEVGHWLGHDHISCQTPGQSAPIMQQQSVNLQGCTFNPWPLASELWSTRL